MSLIAIIAYGTRGDVQPAIALGKTLHGRGHRVRLVASGNFKAWIESHGLEAAASDVDIQQLMQTGLGQEWVMRGTNPLAQVRVMHRLLTRHGDRMARDAWDGCCDAEVVISSFTSDVLAVSIAEKLGAPHVSMPPQPVMIATRDGRAVPNAPLPNRVSILNYLFSRFFLQPFPWLLLGKANNRMRQELLGLPLQSGRENVAARRRMLVVHGYSRHVVPHPADWPHNFHTTGYWFLDEESEWRPPPDLRAFLEAGPPPVYIGFGSMTGRDPEQLTRLLLEAVRRSGQRAVLLSGWAGIGGLDLPPEVFCIERAPHGVLFPLMAAIVHHGGAGTTGASLRAGRPTIIVPHMADQPFWGRRVADLGLGPEPIPRPRLSVGRLAQAMRRAASDEEMQRRAAELGRRIRAEDGREHAADLIEAWLRQKETGQQRQASEEEG
ncbi:MAG TPA: glycosyltransferase [Candidatus Sulfomarinibacteraceae bacterium]|nr:glycosyltransferase [Candidatus Sulfomarinibacteraceae bacterium]